MGEADHRYDTRFVLTARLIFAVLAFSSVYTLGYRLGVPDHYRFLIDAYIVTNLISELFLDLLSVSLFVTVLYAVLSREKAIYAHISQVRYNASAKIARWWGRSAPRAEEDETPGDLGEVAFSIEEEADQLPSIPISSYLSLYALSLLVYWHTGLGFINIMPIGCIMTIIALFLGSRFSWRHFMITINESTQNFYSNIPLIVSSVPRTTLPMLALAFFALGNAKENSTSNYGNIVFGDRNLPESKVVIARENLWLVRNTDGEYRLISVSHSNSTGTTEPSVE